MTTSPPSAEPTNARDLQLWVELRVVAPADTTCPLIALEDQVETAERDHFGGVCTMDIDVREKAQSPSGKRRLTHTMDESCLCRLFLQHGCSPRIVSSRGPEGVVSTTLPDRETLRDLVADIRSVGGSATVQKLTSLSTETDADTIRTFELDVLTERERAVMETAVARGYYDTPRRVHLGELAAEFDVTKQTLSTCLNSAEAKMAKSLIGSP
ncbi:Transcriptional regulator, contains HTH domain [Halanaeroarchaeum sp. HSR-CO]|uniref:helix-turn-helix domain-containing protein n=1 Tax=Halanaeroarchaeum sp. HSR-CO TaxID=2866382 RepID=UPI00217CDBB1|nr:helix-turn-helix domain-containing protein [Halanaeroarchaeum sp. HSR-CO]UWG46609.1 Transcriptional regulator, contains HTH domain [Halanaeroarchaeum sp. HSR-CO]